LATSSLNLPARRTEYEINKFAYALNPSEQVHWASLAPPGWAELARPYMSPTEFDVRSDGGGDLVWRGRGARGKSGAEMAAAPSFP
jgi:hypothetical protein